MNGKQAKKLRDLVPGYHPDHDRAYYAKISNAGKATAVLDPKSDRKQYQELKKAFKAGENV